MMNYYWGYGGPMAFGGFGWLFGFIWWIFVIFVIVSVIRLFFGGRHHRRWEEEEKSDTALDILRQRYAKGEITKKEFDTVKKDLG
jgi:putative membrane protein